MATSKFGYAFSPRMGDFTSMFSGERARKIDFTIRLGELESWTQDGIAVHTLRDTCRIEFVSFGSKLEDLGLGYTVHPHAYPNEFYLPGAGMVESDNQYRFGAVLSGTVEFDMRSMYNHPLMGFVSKAYEYTLSSRFDLHSKKHGDIREVWYKVDDMTRLLYALHCLGARHMRENRQTGCWHEMSEYCQFSGKNISQWIFNTYNLVPAHAQPAAEMAPEPVAA